MLRVLRPETGNPPVQPLDQILLGRCSAMQAVHGFVARMALLDWPVLILAETGTGKDLVAHGLHDCSSRRDKPFVAINCAGIPENLLESELFGHEKGAFTSAHQRRIGVFETCRDGSLFLDEIGDMPLPIQARILRVLQEQQFTRVGGNQTIATNVRVIAATHQNLECLVQTGEFRADLYHRLNSISIWLPPLRERGDDVLLLTEHFLQLYSSEARKQVMDVSQSALELLLNYPWTGNVRELQNVLKQAIMRSTGPVLLPEDLPAQLALAPTSTSSSQPKCLQGWQEHVEPGLSAGTDDLCTEVLGIVEEQLHKDPAEREQEAPATVTNERISWEQLADHLLQTGDVNIRMKVLDFIDRELVHRALLFTHGNKKEAGRRLGISPRTVHRKLREREPNQDPTADQ